MPKTKGKTSKRPTYIPYIKGFSAPTKLKKQKALGPNPGLEFSPGVDFFPPLHKCTSTDDWLVQYKPQGQTFDKFVLENPWLSTRMRKGANAPQLNFNPTGVTLQEKYPGGAIYLLQLGSFSDCSNSPDFDALLDYTQRFLCIPVKKLCLQNAVLVFEKTSVFWQYEVAVKGEVVQKRTRIYSRFNKKTGRYQLNAVSCNEALRAVLPPDALCLVALTMSDLFVDNTDLFIAGLAGGNHRIATFSLFRYEPNIEFSCELWYDINKTAEYKKAERQKLMLLRSCRLAVHELLHLFGVDHCIYYACCMNGSGHLEEDFRQPMFLCPIELRKLHALCNFNVYDRYQGLQEFFVKYGMSDEAEWCDRRMKFIESKPNDDNPGTELSGWVQHK